MANAYVDLGTWWCITPFIGAGVGGSYNKISGFRDDGVSYTAGVLTNSVAYFADNGKWNLPGPLTPVSPTRSIPAFTRRTGLQLHESRRRARPATTALFDGSVSGPTSIKVKDITSHDVKLGVRWDLNSPPAYMPPPLVTKG